MLPFCQRCTGLYVGAALALAVHLVLRPRPTSPLLWLYGLMLLVMVPFGYHWVPQGGVLRTLTGQVFAAGLVGYLWLLPAGLLGVRQRSGPVTWWGCGLCLLASLAILPVVALWGGRPAAWALAALGCVGLACLAVLAAANILLLAAAAGRLMLLRRRLTP